MQDNTSKYKSFTDGDILYGPSGSGQNLNVDLQKNAGDELDTILNDLMGAHVVLVGLQIQSSTGLAVQVTAGAGFVSGQRVRQTGTGLITTLPANTADILVYVAADTPFNLTNRGWPAAFGFTTGVLGADQLLLATVATDGSGIISIVDGRVFCGQLVNGPTAAQKAALVGTGVTAPSNLNRFVVDDDTRWQSLTDLLAMAAQYVTVDVPQILTAVHTFNPTVAGPPFVLGTNAQNQKVIGLEADRLDGQEGAAFHDAALLTGTVPDVALAENLARVDLTNIFLAPQQIAPAVVGPPLQIGIRGAGQLVAGLNADQVDGEEAAALHAAASLTGTILDARLSTNIPNRTVANTFTAPQTIAPTVVTPPLVLGSNAQNQKVIGLDADRLDGQEGSFYQNAANLTGTITDARLSTNVPRRDAPGTFTAKPNFSAGAEVGTGNEVWHEGTDPKFRVKVFHSANQLIINDGSWQILLFNSARYNVGNMIPFGDVTIQKTGCYLVAVGVIFTTNGTGTFRGVRVLLNGAFALHPNIQVAVSALGGCNLNGAMAHQLTLGDVLQVQVAHNASATLNVLTPPEFAVQWVGP